MSVQSLSIVVPGRKCINNCKFCVSRTHEDITYKNILETHIMTGTPHFRYDRALALAKDMGCNTLMLTGECEPQQNHGFLKWFYCNTKAADLFHNIEIQTTGAGILPNSTSVDNDRLLATLSFIDTFSISVSSFDDVANSLIINGGRCRINLKELCSWIKGNGKMLRLSLNLNKEFYKYDPDQLFSKAKELGADQLTLRKLYKSGKVCSQDEWIENNTNEIKDEEYFNYIRMCGTPLEVLPYGNIKYSVNGIGSVADADCMAKHNLNEIRYLILRPDCHLYTRWDDKGSIIY